MNINIFSFPVFLFQFNLNKADGDATNKIIPITITSIDKIINIFIKLFNHILTNVCILYKLKHP
mgnify:CR=1 FL=1